MHDQHSYIDAAIVAGGTVLSVLTSEKTVIFLTVIFTALRIAVYIRTLWRKSHADE